MPPENKNELSQIEIEFEQALNQHSPILQEKIDQLKKQLDEIVEYAEQHSVPFCIDWNDLYVKRYYTPSSLYHKYKKYDGIYDKYMYTYTELMEKYLNYSTYTGWNSSTC